MSDDVIREPETQTGETPAEAVPVDELPVDENPVDVNPVDELPVDETPVVTADAPEGVGALVDDPQIDAPVDESALELSSSDDETQEESDAGVRDSGFGIRDDSSSEAAAAAAVEDAPTGHAADADAGGATETVAVDAAAVAEGELHVPRGPSAELKAIVEALVFASPEPITPRMLYRLLADEPKEDVAAALNALAAEYESRPGLQMVEVAGGFQIVTRPELHEWVRRLFHERSTQKLTVQGLETLAVIAYRQPVTAAEITEIRGVNTSGVLTTLLERHLIKIVGRKNVVGRPFLYATTKEFLIRFGLKDLKDLPRIEDMAEALGFDPPAGLIEGTPREEVLPLEEEPEAE